MMTAATRKLNVSPGALQEISFPVITPSLSPADFPSDHPRVTPAPARVDFRDPWLEIMAHAVRDEDAPSYDPDGTHSSAALSARGIGPRGGRRTCEPAVDDRFS